MYIFRFPKIKDTIAGVPISRVIEFLGLYWGPLLLGNYHLVCLDGGGMIQNLTSLPSADMTVVVAAALFGIHVHVE